MTETPVCDLSCTEPPQWRPDLSRWLCDGCYRMVLHFRGVLIAALAEQGAVMDDDGAVS